MNRASLLRNNSSVLFSIKGGEYKNQILQLRDYLSKGKKELYDKGKRNLPAVIFGASFPIGAKRRSSDFDKYNEIVSIDIDKLNDNELSLIKGRLEADEYICAFWLSPSGKGYKGLVWVDYEIEITPINFEQYHKIAFANLMTYFEDKYGIELDKSGSDIVRLCFYSYDPNLVLKEAIKKFSIQKEAFCDIKDGRAKTKSKRRLASIC